MDLYNTACTLYIAAIKCWPEGGHIIEVLSRKIRSGAKFGPGGPIIAANFGPGCKNRSVCMCAFIGTMVHVATFLDA